MRRVWGVVGWVWLTGCPEEKATVDAGAGPRGPTELTEQEPSDRPRKAQALAASSVVTASLGTDPSRLDEDWYLLSPSGEQQVDLTVSGIPGGNVALEVYDTDRNRLVAVN